MTLESLIAFNAVLLVAIASPGAALLYFIKSAVSGGRLAGWAVGLGLGTAAALWTLAALLGLEALFTLFPWTYAALKIAGATYLIYLAIQTWRHARGPLPAAAPARRRLVLSGFLVNMGNPKSMLFAAAVIVVVFPEGLAARDIALITLNHWLIELTFYGSFAAALGSDHVRQGYLGLKPAIDRVAATVLGALGVRLLLER